MKNGGRKCIRHGVLKRRAGFAVSDTLSTPTDGQKKKGKTLNPKTGKILVQKRGKFSYSHGRGRRGCQLHTADHPSQSSVARLAARARQLCHPGQHPCGPRPPGLPAAHGGPSESVVSGEVGSSRPPIMRPGTAPGRAAAAGVASCTRRAIRVSRQWRGWQLAPAHYATRDSTRAGSGRRGCQLRAI